MTLTQDYTTFKYLKVVFKYAKADANTLTFTAYFKVDEFQTFATRGQYFGCATATNTANRVRRIGSTSSNTSMQFGTSNQVGATTTTNGNIIPLKLIGLK